MEIVKADPALVPALRYEALLGTINERFNRGADREVLASLLTGEDSAVLVDVPITTAKAGALADRVAATGKTLSGICITHGHPVHWFGASILLDRFPGARIVAMPAMVRHMRKYLEPDALGLWTGASLARYPRIPSPRRNSREA